MANKYVGTDLYRVAFWAPALVTRAAAVAEPTPGISASARYRALLQRALRLVPGDIFVPPDFDTLFLYFPAPAGTPDPGKRFLQVCLRERDALRFQRVAASSGLSQSQLACYLILAGAKDVVESSQ